MLKKKIIKINEQLFEKLNVANETIAEKEAIIEKLNREIDSLKTSVSQLEEKLAQKEKVEEEASIPMECADIESATEEKETINIRDYASSIIGKIVIEATRCSNQLSTSGASAENKELINLMLGRTEVAKSEILNVILSEKSDNDKKNLIDEILENANDYFKSIMLQYS